VVGACECSNETWDSTKCGEFLDWVELLASEEGLCSMQLAVLAVSYALVEVTICVL
jgi:hypothetical protein